MKTKRLMMCLLLSMALAVTFIPNVVFAAPENGEEAQVEIPPAEKISEAIKGASEDLPSQDELLWQFLEQQAKGEISTPAKSDVFKKKGSPASRLSGKEKIAYDVIYDAVAEIAEGKQDSAIIRIPLSLLMGGKLQYTAEDLGVDSLINEGSMNEDAVEAFREKYDFDDTAVMRAMMAEVPYELYWYDKTKGYSGDLTDGNFGILYDKAKGTYLMGFAEIDENGYPIEFVEDPAWVFEFRVSADFNPNELAGTTTVDTEKTTAATTAATKAKRIKEAYETSSDLAKLTAYKNEICNLTDYNDQAAKDAEVPYGNPWQMIWVFDEDPGTNVVCEGYSKAFQFLCDLSEFEDNGIESHLMTGTMDWGEGEEAHMWNVVRMDDGKNYLVDVTNCDGDEGSEETSIGYPDWLFLKGYYLHDEETPGTYTYKCREDAEYKVEYTYDEKTHDLYNESELVLSKEDYVEATAHINRATRLIDEACALEITSENIEAVQKAIEAAKRAYETLSEEEQGQLADKYQALLAKESYLQVVIDGLDGWNKPTYVWSDDLKTCTAKRTFAGDRFAPQTESVEARITATEKETCEVGSKTIYTTAEFKNVHFEVQTKTVIEENALGHDWGKINYTWAADNSSVSATRMCSRNNSHIETIIVEATSKITTPPTCTESGIRTFTSNEFKSEEFEVQTKEVIEPATGHTMTHHEAKEATNIRDGNKEYWYCENCRKYFQDRDAEKEYPDGAWFDPAIGGQEAVDAATTAGTAIQNAAKVNKGAYSAASYKAVETAVKALKTVLDNPNATADEIKAATDKLNKAIKALKKKQILKVKKKTIKVKLKKVKKKAQTVKPLTVTGQKGKLTYKGKPVGKKAKKALKINKKTGKITVRKKTKKGTYKMKVTVTAAGTAAYAPGSKTVTVTIKVR